MGRDAVAPAVHVRAGCLVSACQVAWLQRDLACRCGDPKLVMSEEHNFTTPPAPGSQTFPQRLTVVADLGQTHNSSRTLEHIIASQPRVCAHISLAHLDILCTASNQL